jgi:hypothetical protein
VRRFKVFAKTFRAEGDILNKSVSKIKPKTSGKFKDCAGYAGWNSLARWTRREFFGEWRSAEGGHDTAPSTMISPMLKVGHPPTG